MKIEYFLTKLFETNKIKIDAERNLHIKSFVFNRKKLQDNLDLLSKELHMEVELEAILNQRKLKHKEIYIKDISFLEE